jgi:hypothetical protein
MKRKPLPKLIPLGLSGMLLAAGAYATAVAGEMDIHYDRSAVPAIELIGPQVARPDHLHEADIAAFSEGNASGTPGLRQGEIHYDNSAVPAVEWIGPQVAWPRHLREAAFAAFEEEAAETTVSRPRVEDIHYDRTAVPAVELIGPQVARSDRMR